LSKFAHFTLPHLHLAPPLVVIKDVPLLSTVVTVAESARNLDIIIDSQLSIDAHAAAFCRSGYYQLRQLHTVTRSLTTAAAETVVHVFIVNRLDYCNCLLYGVADMLMRRLQSVQNAAVQLVTGLCCCDHITPTLRQLHRLPVQQRVLFKIAVLVFQCLAGLAPSYLADDCQLVSDTRPRRLRLSDSLTCAIRRTWNTYGDRCFAAARPRVWNSLLAELQQCDSLEQFKWCLKTYFSDYGTTE